MVGPIDELPFDEELRQMNYQEYHLSSLEKNNLKEIENMLDGNRFDKSNVKDSLDYVLQLEQHLTHILQVEHPYEGDFNHNMNAALKRVKALIPKLREIRDS